FAFASTHFINHALGLISLEAMQLGQDVRIFFTRSVLGTSVLVLAATLHFIFGFQRFLETKTLRLGLRNLVQLGFGLLIPILLLRHILGMRGVHEMFGVADNYDYALWAMWPNEALRQLFLMALVWIHGCIGIHCWLMMRPWYRRLIWLWYGLAVTVPILGYAGFATAGRAVGLQREFKNPFTPEQFFAIKEAMNYAATSYYVLLVCAIGVWLGLQFLDRYGHKITVSYADGPTVRTPRGLTLLEISRTNRIPHAAVCGGKARCSTCRIRIVDGREYLPQMSETERKVLDRIGAPSNVRLACQLRLTTDATVSTLLPASAHPADGTLADQYHWGVERDVTLLFCDLRGFTEMSAGRLAFDVVFFLNQFLGRMTEAIEDSGGYVDKLMGDGIMAIFGVDSTAQDGATRALAAARAMGGVLASLNQGLRDDLRMPLNIGIGIHTGPAILGRIGAAHKSEAAGRITALGETVNIASRLESLTKKLGVQVAVSKIAMEVSGVAPDEKLSLSNEEIRGLGQPIWVYSAIRAVDLPDPGIRSEKTSN
ncbi:MAG: adenylate/guanylate cyclase domain-containing protein, partial [Tabrizicola sp.]|nr:adenylate/guanylate cyclase domain-containing protein [Tabrizicola sp.]